MRDFTLSPRLEVLARAASSGRNIVDVGTDHGRIPVRLALWGHTGMLTATDLRPAPLERAMCTAREQGVFRRIRFVLCDGLSFDGAQDSDTVILAGMGGETISSILARAPWTKSGTRLILQPQSRQDMLCAWLAGEGYALFGAHLCEDAGRLYAVLSVRGGDAACPPVFIEDLLLRDRDPLLPRWLDRRIRVLGRAAGGMALARRETEADAAAATLSRLQSARKETEQWLL